MTLVEGVTMKPMESYSSAMSKSAHRLRFRKSKSGRADADGLDGGVVDWVVCGAVAVMKGRNGKSVVAVK